MKNVHLVSLSLTSSVCSVKMKNFPRAQSSFDSQLAHLKSALFCHLQEFPQPQHHDLPVQHLAPLPISREKNYMHFMSKLQKLTYLGVTSISSKSR